MRIIMRAIRIAAILSTLAAGIAVAYAHASLDHASPHVGSAVPSAPIFTLPLVVLRPVTA